MRPWIRRAGLGLAVAATGGALLGARAETLARRRARRDVPVPGRLVDVGGGRRLQLDCRGAGSPTIVLEAGLDGYGALGWASVHGSLAATTRTCAYSRAGILWSDPAPGPFDAARAADDLHAALRAAGERAPLVLVGHSLGAPYALAFTGRYPRDVAGLALVDGSHPAQVARFAAAGVTPASEPLLLWTLTRLGPPLLRLGLGRLLPDLGALPAWTPAERAAYRALAPASLEAMLGEARVRERSLALAGRATRLGDRPLVVLTAMRPGPGVAPADAARRLAAWRALHDDATGWSTRGRHVLVPDATHYVHVDRPDVVIAAVRQVVAEVRAGGRPTR